MDAREFNLKQSDKYREILKEHMALDGRTLSQEEKDLFNLKCLRYRVKYGSIDFRSGVIATLVRAISRLEEEMKKKEQS